MKKVALIGCLTAFLFSSALFAQDSIIQWQHTYNGLGECVIVSIANTLDGGYIAVGYTDSAYPAHPDVIVLKLKHDGTTEWKRTYGGSDEDEGYGIVATSDSGYVFTGYTESVDGDIKENHGNADIWVVKLKSNGSIEWEKTFGGANNDIPSLFIHSTFDSGFVFTGYTSSIDSGIKNNGGNDIPVIKVKKDGSLEWFKTFGGTGDEEGADVIQTLDSGYLFVGKTSSNDYDVKGHHGNNFDDIWLGKLDNSGKLLWQKTFGGSDEDFSSQILSIENNEYVIAGNTFSNDGDIKYNHGSCDAWIIKLKKDSVIDWQKTYGGTGGEILSSIVEMPDSGFLFLGEAPSDMGGVVNYHGGIYDSWLVRLKKDNSIFWQTTYGGSDLDEGYKLMHASDGGFVFCGDTKSTDGNVVNAYKDVRVGWIVKLEGDSIITTNIENPVLKNEEFFFYPNPTNSKLYFKLTSPITPLTRREEPARATITDINGRILLTQKIIATESTIDVSTLASGIYLLRYQDADRVWNGKFVKN